MESMDSLKISYDVLLEHLIELTEKDLIDWQKSYNASKPDYALDSLYEIKEIIDKNTSIL